jgi:hypothetical protein
MKGNVMEVLVFKTNANSTDDFLKINDHLSHSFNLQDCSIDLDDHDKVLRVVSDSISTGDVIKQLNNLGFLCQEMDW